MKWPKRAPILACCILSMTPIAMAQTAPPPPASIAVRQVSAADPGHPSIPIAIWSPPSGTGLRLIIISHGTGAAMLSHVDTAQALAQAGFVVVAPMHPGDNFQDDRLVGTPDWFVDRSRHISKVIDFMFGEWEGRARLAPGNVGIFGFSAGGTTALIAVGGVPDLGQIAPHCAVNPEFVCNILKDQAPAAGGPPSSWMHDPRIAAAVIAAPGIGFAFEPAGLADVRVPVQLWAGEADDTVPYASNAGLVRRLLPRAPDFHSVKDATHLSFLAPCTGETPPPLCQDRPGFDREAFHARFNQSVADFFRDHLTDP